MIAIDVGDYSIRFASVRGKGSGARLENCCSIESETRIVDENSVNAEALAATLEKGLAKFREKKASITFSTMPVMYNDYIIPFIAGKRERRTAVQARALSALSPDEYICDYRSSESEKDGKKTLDITAYIVPRAVVEAAQKALKAAGKTPVAFCVSQDCIEAAADAYLPHQSCIVANIDKNTLALHLISAPGAVLTRVSVLENGGELATAVADKISKLMQYHRIKYPDMPLADVYIFGAGADGVLFSEISAELGTEVKTFSVGGADANYAYAAGAAL